MVMKLQKQKEQRALRKFATLVAFFSIRNFKIRMLFKLNLLPAQCLFPILPSFMYRLISIKICLNMGRKIDGVLGIRMTGAGFGGCTVAIIKNCAVDKYIERMGVIFEERFGHKASFYVTRTGDGGREIR